MTFNIQHGLHYPTGTIDLERFSDLIRKHEVDVCGLNEVRGRGTDQDYTAQVEILGDALGFYRYFGEAIRVGGSNPYGNGIVSRYPFRSIETIPVPDSLQKNEGVYYESRCVIRAVIEVNNHEICLLITHMGLAKEERRNAVATVCRLLDDIDSPVILMGDFNTTPEDPVLCPLYERLSSCDECMDVPNQPTFSSYVPREKIDYLFYRGLVCQQSYVVKEIVSDHFAMVAEFSLS
jgi:endonuclease/exonuclease/phosphatase family metal-dependent hydrolase